MNIVDRFYRGDHLTDTEVLWLLGVFKQTADGCLDLGSRFDLAFREAHRQFMFLSDAARSRGLDAAAL